MRFVVSVNIVNMAPMVEGQTYQDRINNGIFADEVMNYMMSTIFSIQVSKPGPQPSPSLLITCRLTSTQSLIITIP